MMLRKRIYDVIDTSFGKSRLSSIYNYVMLAAIFIGLLPLMFLKQNHFLVLFDVLSCIVFIIDYLLRWFTADYHLKFKQRWMAFVLYPISFMAIIDLLSILPTVCLINPAFKAFRVSRLFKILRVVKFVRYFEPLELIISVIKGQRKVLLTVFSLAMFYTFVTALIMFNAGNGVEPETGKLLFNDFFEAFYWAASTLTTVGYGDIYPVNDLGRAISMVSALVGIAIIALPSGVITAAYMEELEKRKKNKE